MFRNQSSDNYCPLDPSSLLSTCNSLPLIAAFCKPVLTTQSSSSMLEQTRVDSSDDTTGKFKGVDEKDEEVYPGGGRRWACPQ